MVAENERRLPPSSSLCNLLTGLWLLHLNILVFRGNLLGARRSARSVRKAGEQACDREWPPEEGWTSVVGPPEPREVPF